MGLFCGSNCIIFIMRSIALSGALGMIVLSDVGTNFGNVKPIYEASLYPSGHYV